MTTYDERSVEIADDIVSTWEISGQGYSDLEERIATAIRKAYNDGIAACRIECEHDWTDRGGPSDQWRECFLCGEQEDR